MTLCTVRRSVRMPRYLEAVGPPMGFADRDERVVPAGRRTPRRDRAPVPAESRHRTRRGYHDPGWRPTVIQSTDHLVGPTEQFGRSVDITAGQVLADPRRRRHLAADRDHSDLDAVHSGDRHEAPQRPDPAATALAEPEVVPDDDERTPMRSRRTSRAKSSADSPSTVASVGNNRRMRTGLAQQPQLVSEAGQHRRDVPVSEVGVGMPFEGDRTMGKAQTATGGSRALQQRTVAEMYAVELAEGHHGRAEGRFHAVGTPEDAEAPLRCSHALRSTPLCRRDGTRP